MNCCGMQTGGAGALAAGAASGRAHETAVAFEGMLLRECLAPLAKPMGFYGDIVLGACTQAIAERSRGGLATMLEALVERACRDAEPPS